MHLHWYFPKKLWRQRCNCISARKRASRRHARLREVQRRRFNPWPAYVRPLFRFLMLTGARKTNALTARFDEMDLESGLWGIPADKSRTGHIMEVILRPEAVKS